MAPRAKGLEPVELTEAQLRRFWAKVDKGAGDGCWNWTARLSGKGMKRNSGGYGRIKINYRDLQAHRVSWVIHYGPVPDGLNVCHHCDNRRCVRPDHLFVGTDSDNMKDMHNKNRHPRRVPMKLNEASAAKIRKLSSEGVAGYKLAKMFGVTNSTISYVINQKTWS
jgi:hypothetical protein